MRPGLPARHDYEYKRNGTANIFMLFAPLVLPEAGKNGGWRHAEVTERRTAIDYAKMKSCQPSERIGCGRSSDQCSAL